MSASFCTSCGAPGTPQQRFCRTCGKALKRSDEARVGASLGPYRIERALARGGMGVVYQAYDERLRRNVALKLLREELGDDSEFRDRFGRESHAAAGLDHPNILPVFDAGEIDGVLYIAARLVDGMDLRRRLEQEGALGLDRALSIVGQIAAALDYAHSRDIVHRDVKPGNVLLVAGEGDEDDHAYLIDFGITKRVDAASDLTAAGSFVGTPDYVSPEQIREQPVDGRADQYALACVLYHCLTGGPPFARGASVDVLAAHLSSEPPRPSDRCTGLAESVDRAVVRALDKNPQRRFETCRAFVAAARVGGRALSAGTPATRALSPRAPRPQPEDAVAAGPPSRSGGWRTAAIAGLVTVLAGAGVALGVVLSQDSKSDAGRNSPVRTIVGKDGAVTVTASSTTPTEPGEEEGSEDRFAPLDVADLDLTSRSLRGFSIDLPSEWRRALDDERQLSPATVTRRRTEAVSLDGEVSVLVDHLTGFETPPRRNRELLDRQYARTRPGYVRIGYDEYDIGGVTGFEWRYRYESKGGREARRTNVLFRRGGHDFAVLASGMASYDDLAALARAAAESVVLDGTSAPEPDPGSDPDPGSSPDRGSDPDPPLSVPESGEYRGIGYQRGSGSSASDDYTVVMSFSSSGSSVEYPDLGCEGRLIPDGHDGRRRVYRERITSGPCIDEGTWRVRVVSGSRLEAKWTKAGSATEVTTTVTR